MRLPPPVDAGHVPAVWMTSNRGATVVNEPCAWRTAAVMVEPAITDVEGPPCAT